MSGKNPVISGKKCFISLRRRSRVRKVSTDLENFHVKEIDY
jgi:hypothetical protein